MCYITPYFNKHLLKWNYLVLGLGEEHQLSGRGHGTWDISLSTKSLSPQILSLFTRIQKQQFHSVETSEIQVIFIEKSEPSASLGINMLSSS